MAGAEWEWMAVELPLEEQLMVERQVRAIQENADAKEIAALCGTLIRQSHHQQKLLQQAIGRIIELEVYEENCEDQTPKSSWWRTLASRFAP